MYEQALDLIKFQLGSLLLFGAEEPVLRCVLVKAGVSSTKRKEDLEKVIEALREVVDQVGGEMLSDRFFQLLERSFNERGLPGHMVRAS